MTEHYYWLSCMKLTVYAQTNDVGIVTATAPITRKFVGQPLASLTAWLTRLGGFEMAELPAPSAGERGGGG